MASAAVVLRRRLPGCPLRQDHRCLAVGFRSFPAVERGNLALSDRSFARPKSICSCKPPLGRGERKSSDPSWRSLVEQPSARGWARVRAVAVRTAWCSLRSGPHRSRPVLDADTPAVMPISGEDGSIRPAPPTCDEKGRLVAPLAGARLSGVQFASSLGHSGHPPAYQHFRMPPSRRGCSCRVAPQAAVLCRLRRCPPGLFGSGGDGAGGRSTPLARGGPACRTG